MKTKALSIVSPSGTRIAQGYKTIEVRSWIPDLKLHEDFLIVENDRFLTQEGDSDPNGRAVAIASITSIRPYQPEDIPAACATVWEEGYYAWELSNIRPISNSGPIKAERGIYSVDLMLDKVSELPKTTPELNEAFYLERFHELLKRNKLVSEILDRSKSLGFQDWAVGAGFLQQSIFNLFHGKSALEGIKDVDWVYFDSSDLSAEAEEAVVTRVHHIMKDLPLPFDVKNQARVHLWYKSKFGYDIEAYKSLEDAISTWPTTSTAVALTQVDSETRVLAPFGLSDLMNMTVRPNKRQITEAIYLAKVERWRKHWPRLQIIPWERA